VAATRSIIYAQPTSAAILVAGLGGFLVPQPKQDHIKDLTPDPANRRGHTPRNVGMIVDSLHAVGAARSIVIDEHGVILAGNGLVDAAAEAGITKLQVVDADGSTIIAVRRTGLSDQAKRALALYDNRTAELAEWDCEQLRADQEAGLDLQPWWREDELANVLAQPAVDADWADAVGGLSGEASGFQQMTFSLTDDQVETVKRAIGAVPPIDGEATGNPNRNGNALAFLCAAYGS
jgi:hypothetical protein